METTSSVQGGVFVDKLPSRTVAQSTHWPYRDQI